MSLLAESFVFGLANSLHCAGMCGPLAACLRPTLAAVGTYHAARAAAYAAAGVILGSLGVTAGASRVTNHAALVAFVLAGTLLLLALGVPARLGRLPVLSRVTDRAAGLAGRLPPAARGAVLGGLTPLLPCGLLYGVYAAAAVSGSWHGGAVTMLGFALGSIPLLLLAQLNAGWILAKLGPAGTRRAQAMLLLLASAVLIWRGWAELAEMHDHG